MVVVPGGHPRALAWLERVASNRGSRGPEPMSSRAAREPATRGRSRLRPGSADRRRGASAVELALLLPALLIMLLGVVDFCRLFYAYTTITNCARNGALWLCDPLASTQSPYATYTAAALADANGLSPALTAAEISSSTGTDSHGDSIVTVTVSYPFKLITNFLGSNTVTLSRQVTMRKEPQSPNPS